MFSEARYTQATAFTAIDWRESPGYTRSGGLYALDFHEFRDSDDNFSFRRIDAELRQYIPLLKEHNVRQGFFEPGAQGVRGDPGAHGSPAPASLPSFM